jgi:hypothetical protein
VEAPDPARFRSIAASKLAKYPGEFLHWLRARWPTPVEALIEGRLPLNTPSPSASPNRIFRPRVDRRRLNISARRCGACGDPRSLVAAITASTVSILGDILRRRIFGIDPGLQVLIRRRPTSWGGVFMAVRGGVG